MAAGTSAEAFAQVSQPLGAGGEQGSPGPLLEVVKTPSDRCYSYAIAERQARSIRSLLTKERGI